MMSDFTTKIMDDNGGLTKRSKSSSPMRSNGTNPNTLSSSGTTIAVVDTATSADYYFDSYSHFGIHEEMLKDDIRTKSYVRTCIIFKRLNCVAN